MRPCSKCKINPPAKSHRYCNPCKAALMRATRPKHSELTEEQRLKATCRSYTNMLIRRGTLTRQPCQNCGAKAQAHHPDYSNPRLVEWLCFACHREHHKAEYVSKRNDRFKKKHLFLDAGEKLGTILPNGGNRDSSSCE